MKTYLWSTLLLVLVLNSNCSGQNKNHQLLSPELFFQKINETPKVKIIDVRTPDEYAEKHLKNAQNINWNDADFEKQILVLDKKTPVFVYCKSGGRSASASKKMVELGFATVYELDNGITGWIAGMLPVQK